MGIDFLAIGDAVVDDFIRLKDAKAHCKIDNEGCELCVRFGDKVPFESSTKVYGVGNAGNAAVAAARLGLSTALVTNIGKDQNGDIILKNYKKEGIDTSLITEHANLPTNYHYVLWYGDERTILVNHQDYQYDFPTNTPVPKTVYFTSIGAGEAYHDQVADWLEQHPTIFFAFQPGTFQISMGDKLARLYQRADILFGNKEEYQRILDLLDTHDDVSDLMKRMRDKGVKTPVLTDGRHGANALEGDSVLHLDIYPDPKAPVERTGAGDAFSSTTAAYLTLGYSLKDAMQRGLINSAYVVQQIGAQAGLLTKKELETKLR